MRVLPLDEAQQVAHQADGKADTGDQTRPEVRRQLIHGGHEGHGPGQETLQQGKRDVDIVDIAPVGNYAIKPTFSDGHDSGLYSWDYLYALGRDQEALWNDYLEALERTGGTRDPAKVPPPAPKGGCGHHH